MHEFSITSWIERCNKDQQNLALFEVVVKGKQISKAGKSTQKLREKKLRQIFEGNRDFLERP